ncbi:putative disease resistance protein RGA3 [Bienertia sinuspersici]
MLELVTLYNHGLSDIEAITNKLQEKLKGESFLLILDDVWEKNQLSWDSLIYRLQRIGDPSKSLILITTRSAEVVKKARAIDKHNLNGLSIDDGWTLLQQKAFITSRSGQNSSDFEDVGRNIVKKCDGVPLAIKAMGALLQSKERPRDWESILTSELWELPQEDENNILPSLLLSYNHLPYVSVKQCFAYCAIFPKDSKLDKHVLIALWMAQGFLPKSQTTNLTTTMEDVGEDYFDFLLNNSFIEEEEVNEIGEVKWYKMHDLVHDLAIYVSKKNMLVWKADSQLKEVSDARHFVINFEKGKLTPELPTELDVRKLRTLNFLSGLPRWDSIICARYVRVLIMADIALRDIPIGIGQLIHLRYLDLSGNYIIKLPESICQLYQLQTLRIEGNSRLKELPREWYKLENLIHFKTETLLSVSRGLGLLTNLQTLPSLELHDEFGGWKIDELENLNQIRGKVCISGLEHVKNYEEARKANLGRKNGILQLILVWNLERKESSENTMVDNNDEDVLGGLEPPPYIKSLVVKGFMGMGFPRWIKTMVVNHTILLTNLIIVELIDCERCGQLPTLGKLPNLKILKLEGFKKVEIIGNEFYYESSSNNTSNYDVGIIAREEQGLFGALKELSFSNFENLTTWMPCSETSAFTSLVLLKIENCPNLERVPSLHSQYLKNLQLDNVGGTQTLDIIKYNHTNLEILVIRDCENIKSFPNGEMEMMMTSLKKLVISRCPALGGIPTSIGNYTSLESLEIKDCKNLKSFPDGEMEMRMTSLKELVISRCPALGGIPTSIGNCTSLESLEIGDCENLKSFLDGEMEMMMTSLKKLVISRCQALGGIPTSIGNCTSLESLEIKDCKNLKSFPDGETEMRMTSLKELVISRCPALGGIPTSIGNCTSLESLKIFDCENLKSFPDLEMEMRMTSLKELVIFGCLALGGIPTSIGNCTSLESLEISNCENLKSFPDGEMEMRMTSLKELVIFGCPALCGIPTSIGNCTSLESLWIFNCENLKSCIPTSIGNCTSLKSLSIGYCPSIEGPVPDLSKLQRLEKLDLRNAGELLRSAACLISQVHHLKELTIGGFRDEEQIISFVSHIKSSYSLRKVELYDWPKIKNMPQQLQYLLPSPTLQRLVIQQFDELEALPEWIGNLSSLQTLYLQNCKELKFLPSKQAMLRLSQLQDLCIIQCPLLKEKCNERTKNSPDSQWPNIERIPDITIA